jgi:D-alanyl-D-alanine carboxypeptidase
MDINHWIALTAATAVTCVLAAGSTLAASTPAHSDAAQLRALVAQDVAAGAPGVIVRVDDGSGRVTEIAEQAPWSRRDHTLTPTDRFRMGSNTKTMVATVIMQLVAEHRLALTDPVEKWLPGAIPNGGAITLRMLLDHTSGLFNYLDDPAVLKAFTGQDPRLWTPRQVLAAAMAHPPLFAPGTQYSYSNTNYLVLGLIAEKATGKNLADLVQQRIAAPLHLRDTYLVTGADRRDNPTPAHGYEPDAARLAPLLPPGTPAGTAFVGPRRPDGYVDTTDVNLSAEWAAGGMVSSAQDWARFDTALLSGRLLPPAELQQMETTVSEGPSTPNRYGLGLEQVVTPCGTVWGHVGQVPGYSSEDYTDSTGRRTVSVFTSTIFGIADPTTSAADQAVINGAVCTMLDKPIPATTH